MREHAAYPIPCDNVGVDAFDVPCDLSFVEVFEDSRPNGTLWGSSEPCILITESKLRSIMTSILNNYRDYTDNKIDQLLKRDLPPLPCKPQDQESPKTSTLERSGEISDYVSLWSKEWRTDARTARSYLKKGTNGVNVKKFVQDFAMENRLDHLSTQRLLTVPTTHALHAIAGGWDDQDSRSKSAVIMARLRHSRLGLGF